MEGFGKVCASLWDGTLGDQWEAWSLFVFMLAHADAKGIVDMTPGAISRRSCIPLEKVHSALAVLSAPDGESRSKAEEGRRIVPLEEHREWGWRIVNYLRYRWMRDPEARREQTREAVRKHREKATVSHGKPPKAQAEAEAEAEAVDSKSLVRPPVSLTPRFDEFWKAYPRRTAKKPTLAKWMKLGVETNDDLFAAIMAGLERAKKSEQWLDAQFIPHPATFLNQERWTDEPPIKLAESAESILRRRGA